MTRTKINIVKGAKIPTYATEQSAGADLNVRTFSKERPSQRLEDMSYNELIDLYKRVRAEFERRNNEIETLIKEDMNYTFPPYKKKTFIQKLLHK